MNLKLKKVLVLLFALLMLVNSFPTRVDAHRAYFLQVLIDEGQLMYTSNVIKDSELKEANKTEAKLWNYDGNFTTDYEKLEEDGGPNLPFTFPSIAEKHFKYFKAKNNATKKDEKRAYEISDTLIPNLNELLLIINGGKPFNSVDDLIAKSEELASLVNGGGSVTVSGVNISSSGNNVIVNKDGESYEYLVRMKKGYKSEYLEDGETESPLYTSDYDYSGDVDYISIADMITQANYTYVVKGHSSADLLEYAKPGTIELKLMEFVSSTLASLRSQLGLRDINELVFNEGIVGSNMYYNGMMPTSWFQKSMSFHMIFQAMTWIALGVAIIKLAFQRNLATISASSRITLMDGVKDLIMSGFMLMGIFIAINLLGSLNRVIVDIFFETAPDYSGFNGEGLEIASFGGVLLQLYYFLITLYLNVIYIARAISLAILIATAPIFVGSVAFQSKNKDLFETWGRLLVADIFVQSFHGFVLSFFLAIQMSTTRGIELAVVSFALIPATKMFKQIITKNSGGLMNSMGMGLGMGLGMAGTVAGAGLGMFRGRTGGKGDYKGSMDESNGFNSQMSKEGISTSTPNSSTTAETLNSMKTKSNKSSETMGKNPMAEENASYGAQTFNQQKSGKPFKNSGTLKREDIAGFAKKTGSVAKDVAVGGAKVTAGIATGMAFGGLDGGRTGLNLMRSGAGNLKSGISTAGGALSEYGKKGINTINGSESKNTLIGAEELSNGNVAIHRDKDALNSMGLDNSTMNEKDNLQLTYDTSKLNKGDYSNIEKIREKHANGDSEYLKSRGIENVYDTKDGKVAVEYNDYGKELLGYNKAYTTDNRVVEVKTAGQSLESNLTYDISDKKQRKNPSSGEVPKYKNAKNEKARDIYDGPTDGGTTKNGEGGQSYKNLNLDDIM